MLSREDVINAYRFILGREPESGEVIEHHRKLGSLEALREALLTSEEFRISRKLIEFRDKWVCAEIFDNLRIWLNLGDKYVSYGCLLNDYEPSETKFVRDHLKSGQTFVDIGANIGWFTLLAASIVGDDGKVISIEPRNDTYQHLVRSICESHVDHIVETHHTLLSDEIGFKEIAWATETDNPGGTHMAHEGLPENFSKQRVLSLTLDEIMGDRGCDFIKIDVEGAEPLVFQGARSLLQRCKPVILSEIFPKQLQNVSGCTDKEYIDLMRGFGYNCYLLVHGDPKQKIEKFPENYHKELASVVFMLEEG